MRKKQFIHLLKKYRQGKATLEECRFIESYYALFETESCMEVWLNRKERDRLKQEIKNEIRENIRHGEHKTTKVRKLTPRISKIAAAVALLLITGITLYVLNDKIEIFHESITTTTEQRHENDIKPGGNKAILTLANGKQIVLNSANNGSLAQQGNTKVIKLDSGILSYSSQLPKSKGQLKDDKELIQYNTITTPKGGQYEIILPDGSKVWLNAASSLHFPTAFTEKERRVKMSGEAYFEVAKQTTKPFIVRVNELDIKVLGTQFNVHAYEDEGTIKTTLAEGAVRVSKGNESREVGS